MDIDDILASVDRDDLNSAESAARDFQELTRLWVAERSAPEILPWPEHLMTRMMDRVSAQITKIEDLTSSTDPSTLATSNATTAYDTAPSKTQNLNLTISILQSDLSRTQYLIRSLLRQRLAKLSKYAPYYLALSNGTLPPQSSASQSYYDEYGAEKETPLSASETDFLRAHQDLLKAHYDISFLHSFPQSLTRLDDNNGGVSMIQGPETKSPVFVRCLVERGWVVERDGMGEGHERGDMETAGEDELVMQQGDIWVTRWEGVREGVRRGILEVL